MQKEAPLTARLFQAIQVVGENLDAEPGVSEITHLAAHSATKSATGCSAALHLQQRVWTQRAPLWPLAARK